MAITIKITGMDKIKKAFATAPKAVGKAMDSELNRQTSKLATLTRKRFRPGSRAKLRGKNRFQRYTNAKGAISKTSFVKAPQPDRPRSRSGFLRGSIRTKKLRPLSWALEIGANYARFVEEGGFPFVGPSIKVIKKTISKDIQRVAVAAARKHFGTVG
jgi:hypothetical protein